MRHALHPFLTRFVALAVLLSGVFSVAEPPKAGHDLPVISPETKGYHVAPARRMSTLIDIQAIQDAIKTSASKGLEIDLSNLTQLLDGTAVDPGQIHGALVVGPYPFETAETQFKYKRFRWYENIKGGKASIPLAVLMKARYNSEGWKKTGYVAIRLRLYSAQKGADRFLGLYDTFLAFHYDGKQVTKLPTIMEGPLVHMVTSNDPSRMVISVRLDAPERPMVVLNTGATFSSTTNALWHEIKVTGLQPATNYRYHIRLGATKSAEYRLTSAPARGSSRFSFGYAGDARSGMGGGERSIMGSNHRIVEGLFSVAYAKGADFMLFGGDMINGYTASVTDFRNQLHSFKQAAAGFWHERPLYTALGNHEALLRTFTKAGLKRPLGLDRWPYATESAEALFGAEFIFPQNGPEVSDPRRPTYKENVYSFQYGSLRAIAFNNNYWICKKSKQFGGAPEGYIMADQMAWIEKELQDAERDPTVRHIVLFAQEPMFPNSGHTKDGLWYHGNNEKRAYALNKKTGKLEATGPGILEIRDHLLGLLGKSTKVLAVLGSDEHAYHRMLVSSEVPIGNLKKDDSDGNGKVCETANDCSPLPSVKTPFWSIVSGGAGAPYYAELPTPWNRWWRERGEGGPGSPNYVFSSQSHICLFTVDGDKVSLEVLNRFGDRIDYVADLAKVKSASKSR